MNGGLLVKILPKGQITIPVKFRRQLGLKEGSYLLMRLVGRKLVLQPVKKAWSDLTEI